MNCKVVRYWIEKSIVWFFNVDSNHEFIGLATCFTRPWWKVFPIWRLRNNGWVVCHSCKCVCEKWELRLSFIEKER